jgi:exodeoxyribonuclease-3
VRLATWNVNSALSRLPRLLPWLDERQPDVVCLQETKLSDEAFAESFDAPLAERGYQVAHVGEGRWNGVALLSRVGLEDVERELPGVPRFPDADSPVEARAVTATCGGLRVTSVYVPNGRAPADPHYAYKLEWLAALRESVAKPDSSVVAGDMNIAPTNDVVRDRWPDPYLYTYWDYQKGRFHQDKGMRIDLVLAGADPAGRVAAAWVDRKARKGKGPSDHAPVIIDLDDAPDGDIGPVVPPASNPVR